MSSISSVSQGMSFVDPSDMDTSSSVASSPTLSASRPLADATLEEHPLYHFHDGSLAFEIEGVKYRVHSSLLARHCGFASTWAQDLRNPVASGISRTDMDSFLSMIYLATYEFPDLNLSAEKWTSILRLAAKWKSDGIRALAVKKLAADLPPFDKLLLCRKYDVPGWLAPACAALALRPAPLTMVEAEQLEKSDIVRVFLAREAVSKGGIAATEEAISEWIAGFLSTADRVDPTSVASAPAPASASQPSAAKEPKPVKPAVDSTPALAPQPTLERATEVSKEDTSRRAYRAEAPTSFPSEKDESFYEIPPAHTTSEILDEAVGTSSAQEALRPALSVDTSPFRTPSRNNATFLDDSVVQKAGPSRLDAPYVLPTQAVTPPIVPVRTPEEKFADAVDAIRAQRYDEGLNSLTLDNIKAVAGMVASSLIAHNPQKPGIYDLKRLQLLLRAVMHRAVTSPSFIPCGAQFVAALSTRSSLENIRFEVALHDDMQSLTSKWATFRAGGEPSADRAGVMVDSSTISRTSYQAQMGHGKGFFRTLVRLGVLPATNKYVEMLVKTYPLVANP
ncbi:hypothetical protein PENSPDRAFT_747648 [Peniophora sp. CONT]|nr:hypothetical protein PENSPDRAFT_747648 [Peniophora sp. CONT]